MLGEYYGVWFFVCMLGGQGRGSAPFVVVFLHAKAQLMMRVLQSRKGRDSLCCSGPRRELRPI